MKRDRALKLSLTPRDRDTIFQELLALGIAQAGPDGPTHEAPNTFTTDPLGQRNSWKHRGLPHSWRGFVSWNGRQVARVANTRYPYDVRSVLDLLRTLDFSIAATNPAVDGWWIASDCAHPYPRPWCGFGRGHFGHGWMCAFSGEDGHARLVSRRWLDHGPWRVIRDEDHDLTLVVFHDLDTDEGTAIAQAHPGHRRMGIHDEAGFIQTDFPWDPSLQATGYNPATRTLDFFVAGREVEPFEMLQAAATKLYQPYEEGPVDRVVYTFLHEADARRHLHDLWLHGLEVRYTAAGPGERFRRIDDTYKPPPYELPDWVHQVRDREGF